jgi:hypothetical protein
MTGDIEDLPEALAFASCQFAALVSSLNCPFKHLRRCLFASALPH